MYICWYRHYAHSNNTRNVFHIKLDFQYLRSNTEKNRRSHTRDCQILFHSRPLCPVYSKSNCYQWNLWRAYHCRHFCEERGWMTGLTCWKERGTTRRWCLVGVSIYETTFRGISIRTVTAVDVSSTLRLPATSHSDWQTAW